MSPPAGANPNLYKLARISFLTCNVRSKPIVILKKTSMKMSVSILFLIAAIGCTKHTATSKFAGAWSGSYSSRLVGINPPIFDTGSLHITVDGNNSATGTLQSLQGGTPTIMKGTVDPSSGAISIGTGNVGGDPLVFFGLSGTLSLDSGSGTLGYPWATTSGWWATKN